MDRHLEILKFEQLLLQHEARQSTHLLEKLLSDDFIEFGASGKSWTKQEVIVGLKSEVLVTRTLSDFSLRRLADDVVLATYRCLHQYVDGTESSSLRSSIWKAHDDRWQMVFHQGTRASD